MLITKDTLPALADRQKFVSTFSEYVKTAMGAARLFPRLAEPRVIEAHGAWQDDLQRVANREQNLDDGLDHFKQMGHLAFWVRRMSPVVEAHDITANIADAPGMPITADEQAFRDLLFAYSNEYLAFDFGYQICLFYERGKAPPSQRAETMLLSREYYNTMCHFLKYKTVSPHALFLIYKSLFFV
jgi:hypothetical protein